MTDPHAARPVVRRRDASTLSVLLSDRRDRAILLTGGVVLSMDPVIGDLMEGDVLVTGDTIAAVGADLVDHPLARGATVVDCRGLILTPGFQDSHRHSWQNQLRRFIPDDDLDGYFRKFHGTFAHHYRPHDMYVGNLVSALSSIDAGITTVADVSHNSRSAAHSDAAIAAWDDVGIRAVHASSAPFDGPWDQQWPDDLDRLASTLPSSGLITLRMALFPKTVDMIPETVAFSPANVAIARGLGLGLTVDAVFGDDASAVIVDLHARGLLGPDVTYVHGTDLSDAAWSAISESGGRIALAPTSDAQVGMCSGVAPVQTCLDLGLLPSISIDVECCLAGDMFSNMRALLTLQRAGVFTRRHRGDESPPALLTDRQVLRFATVGGAAANGLSATTGSLSPGKQADLLGIRHTDVNVFPLNNAVATVVQASDARNIELVLVGGQPRKWGGQVLGYDLDDAHRLAVESRDYLVTTAGVELDILA